MRPRLVWDRAQGLLETRRGARQIAILSGGTIPDRGLYPVYLSGTSPRLRLGELDEEMVFESFAGDVFLLGASSWRIEEISHDSVVVVPAPGEPGRTPFWHGDRPGRPREFGEAIGALCREIERLEDGHAKQLLVSEHALAPLAAQNLLSYVREQCEASALPTDRRIVVERFRDEVGDLRIAVLTPFGARVHAPWAIVVAARLRQLLGLEVDFMYTDDGLVFRLPDADTPPDPEWFIPDLGILDETLIGELGSTSLFAARFRENAARALLLPRKRPGKRTPLWVQRRRSADLLKAACRFEDFPIMLETYRECLKDVFDLDGLKTILRGLDEQTIHLRTVDSKLPSPFAGTLLFSYVAGFIYEGDAPLAERRAQALSLNHELLRELLGEPELRELFDTESIDTLEQELQRLGETRRLRDADDVHDLLRDLGDLSRVEIEARGGTEIEQGLVLAELLARHRILDVRLAATERYIAIEDAATYRDALGVVLPLGVPNAFLEARPGALELLLERYARSHGPFGAEQPAQRLGLGVGVVERSLDTLVLQDRVLAGAFLPNRRGREYCHPDVLRRLKRRTLSRLRKQVEPVDTEAYARFLTDWHGIGHPASGLDAVLGVVEQLQGAELVASELEALFALRVPDSSLRDLDELCAAGEILWRGESPLGPSNGRISLFSSESFSELAAPKQPAPGELEAQIRVLLKERGALFFDEITRALGGFPGELLDALWRLVWAGEARSDTLLPLRSLLRQGRDTKSRGRDQYRSRRSRAPGSEGRWSLLPSLEVRDETRFVARLVEQWLRRHGVITREVHRAENTRLGYSTIYSVLKAMENAGQVRRGYFVAGLGGTQFVSPGAEERLRSFREAPDARHVSVLPSTDPANPYGAMLPWPEVEKGRYSRSAGQAVILRSGELLGGIARGGQAILGNVGSTEPRASRALEDLARALADRVETSGQPAFIERFNDQPTEKSALAEPLRRVGFSPSARGYFKRPGGARSRG
jgi:ATP-dependent Lhr-like helicase